MVFWAEAYFSSYPPSPKHPTWSSLSSSPLQTSHPGPQDYLVRTDSELASVHFVASEAALASVVVLGFVVDLNLVVDMMHDGGYPGFLGRSEDEVGRNVGYHR